MPVILDRVRRVLDVPDDFNILDTKILVFDVDDVNRFPNGRRKPRIIDVQINNVRSEVIEQVLISNKAFDKFRYSLMCEVIYPCVRHRSFIFKDVKINGLVFYKLDESFKL
jgi:hypothetical protein